VTLPAYFRCLQRPWPNNAYARPLKDKCKARQQANCGRKLCATLKKKGICGPILAVDRGRGFRLNRSTAAPEVDCGPLPETTVALNHIAMIRPIIRPIALSLKRTTLLTVQSGPSEVTVRYGVNFYAYEPTTPCSEETNASPSSGRTGEMWSIK
jgi:hypothetical protein